MTLHFLTHPVFYISVWYKIHITPLSPSIACLDVYVGKRIKTAFLASILFIEAQVCVNPFEKLTGPHGDREGEGEADAAG